MVVPKPGGSRQARQQPPKLPKLDARPSVKESRKAARPLFFPGCLRSAPALLCTVWVVCLLDEPRVKLFDRIKLLAFLLFMLALPAFLT